MNYYKITFAIAPYPNLSSTEHLIVRVETRDGKESEISYPITENDVKFLDSAFDQAVAKIHEALMNGAAH